MNVDMVSVGRGDTYARSGEHPEPLGRLHRLRPRGYIGGSGDSSAGGGLSIEMVLFVSASESKSESESGSV